MGLSVTIRLTLAAILGLILPVTVSAGIADHSWQRFVPADTSPDEAGAMPDLSMLTDLPPKVATALLQELDQFDVLVDEYVGPFIPIASDIAPALAAQQNRSVAEEPLHLLVLRRRKDFLRLFRPGHFSAFTLPTLDKTVLVVGPMIQSEALRQNLLHEYVHYRLRRDVPGSLPLWFEEGLASFLSEVGSSSKDPYLLEDSFSRASTRPNRSDRIRNRETRADLEELLARRDLEGLNREAVFRFYRTSHAVVRFLYTQADIEPALLARSLVLGEPAFPLGVGVDLKHIQRSLRSLKPGWQKGPFSKRAAARSVFRGRAETGAVGTPGESEKGAVAQAVLVRPVEVTPVSANEVRARLADAALLMNPKRARSLYADITAIEPDNLHALLGGAQALRVQSETARARELFARAQKLAPEKPEVLITQAALGTTGCIVNNQPHCRSGWRNSMLALRDALDEQPDNYEAIYRLGLAHLYLGQPGEAQGYLEVSWQRVPWSPRVNFFLGEAMRLAGDTRARWYLSNAQRWAASDYFRTAAGMALAALDKPALEPEGGANE